MALEVTGKLIKKFDTQQISDNFRKREFVIEISETGPSGMTFTNFASFQLVQDKVSSIDAFQNGDDIKVSFNIRGNKWEKDGNVRYITNLNAWRIEKVGVDNPYAAPPAGGYTAPSVPTQQPPTNFEPPKFNNDADSDLPF